MPAMEPLGGHRPVQVWLIRGNLLFATQRIEPDARSPHPAQALDALLAGPTRQETACGVGTAVPAGTQALRLRVDGGVATVDLSAAFGSAASRRLTGLRLAQVVYTLTQFQAIRSVRFLVGGQRVDPVSAFGGLLRGPATRADYADLMPPVLVESPVVGQPVGDPVTVAGTADGSGGRVTVWVLDSAGNRLGSAGANVACGEDCRGAFTVRIVYDHASGPGVIRVSEQGGGAGRPGFTQEIPVSLSPS